MDDNSFKRLTFRFQGGKGGLPKATTGEEAVAASLTVTVALGTAKKQSQESHKARRQRQAQEKKDKKAGADAEAGDGAQEGTDDNPGTTAEAGESATGNKNKPPEVIETTEKTPDEMAEGKADVPKANSIKLSNANTVSHH